MQSPNRTILTCEIAKKLLKAQLLGQSKTLVSLDLGKTYEEVLVNKDFSTIRGVKVPQNALEKLKEGTIYVLEDEKLKSVDFFSEDTNFYYKLKPTKDFPFLALSSVPMNRFKSVSPKESAKLMLSQIAPIKGKVLDTCCGLGYTSIGAANAKGSEEVVVFEKDENVLRIAEYNPYSAELFTNPKIKLNRESVFEGIKNLSSNYFDRILHDPPTPSFTEELYSAEFYKQLFRVAKNGAILYHYCPNPGKTKGKEFWPVVAKHLQGAGFTNCKYDKNSSGIRCVKP